MRLTEKISIAATAVILFKVLVGGLTLTIGTFSLTFGPLDGMLAMAVLAPSLGASHLETYVNRGVIKNVDKV